MKRFLLGILACSCLSQATAQVSFQLDLMADRKTYVVSMVSTETWAYPQNITGTAQVTIRIPANTRFTAGRITSLQQGVQWLDNARIERPSADPTHDYVSFSLTSMATKNIPYVRGVETPLFTFQNLQNDCVGKAELVDNNEAVVKNITAAGFNVKNHISVLAKKGEAFTTNQNPVNRVVDCAQSTATQAPENGISVQNVYPIPATDLVTIEWTNAKGVDVQNTKLLITNMLGQEVFTQKIDPLSIKGTMNKVEVNVSAWASGLYLFHFVNDKGASTAQKILK